MLASVVAAVVGALKAAAAYLELRSKQYDAELTEKIYKLQQQYVADKLPPAESRLLQDYIRSLKSLRVGCPQQDDRAQGNSGDI